MHSLNAKPFFDNEAEQQAYIEHAEKEYLEATITLKDILFNSKNDTRKVSTEEVDDFLKMGRSDQVDYIKNYKARAEHE